MLNIVLFQPEIPENTGNIARNCVGFNARLHMIRPYGFILDNNRMKRAGLDYWDNLTMIQYDDWNDFLERNKLNNESKNIFLVTKFASKNVSSLTNQELINDNTYFVFGRETKGLTKEIMDQFENQQIKLEMNKNVRSFNLSNCVAILSYEFHKITNFKYLHK